MSATPWIIVFNASGGAPANTMPLKCERCGAVLPISTPVLVDEWCAAANSFVERHSACQPPAPALESSATKTTS